MLNPQFAPNTMILCAVCLNRDGKLFAGSARFPEGTVTVADARSHGFHMSHARGLTYGQVITEIEFASIASKLAPIVVEDWTKIERQGQILAARELAALDEEAAELARTRAARKFARLSQKTQASVAC